MSSEQHLNQAMLYRDEGRYDEAIVEIQRALELRVGNTDPLRILAQTQWAAGQEAVALTTLEAWFHEQREGASETALHLARLHSLGEDHPRAVTWARAAVSLAPEDDGAWSRLAFHLLNVEDFEEARKAASEAVRLDAKDPANYLNLAVACEDLGEVAEAISAYRNILSLDPTDHDARAQLTRLIGDKAP